MAEQTQDELRDEVVRLQEVIAAKAAEQADEALIAKAAATRLNLLESVMETVPVGVVISDAKGRIIHGNSHVEKMVRHPVFYSEDVDDYHEWKSFHAGGRRVQSHEYPLARVIAGGEDRAELDVHYERGDGTRFWMRIVGEPVKEDDGTLIGATVALIDIDEEIRLQEAQKILIAELNHRVKNAFAVIKSIVGQSLRGAPIPEGLRATLDARLDAYAKAHSKLIGTKWDSAILEAVAVDILESFGSGRVQIKGPQVEIPSREALAFSMAFYELATNAVKYGALSVPEGQVALTWSISNDPAPTLNMSWKESGGPVPTEPERKGFGSFIIGRALAAETGGRVDVEYPSDGFSWHLTMPAPGTDKEEKEEVAA